MPLSRRQTLTQYLIEQRKRFPQAIGDLNALILDVSIACKAIARRGAQGSRRGGRVVCLKRQGGEKHGRPGVAAAGGARGPKRAEINRRGPSPCLPQSDEGPLPANGRRRGDRESRR